MAEDHLNRSAQIGDILRDRGQQNRVVDNVMNFFRYKDPAEMSHLVPQNPIQEPVNVYTDQTAFNSLNDNKKSKTVAPTPLATKMKKQSQRSLEIEGSNQAVLKAGTRPLKIPASKRNQHNVEAKR